ncbi:hypothetical protein Tco_1327348 [Tanacetum coccineum]
MSRMPPELRQSKFIVFVALDQDFEELRLSSLRQISSSGFDATPCRREERLTLHNGNNVFDCIVGKEKWGCEHLVVNCDGPFSDREHLGILLQKEMKDRYNADIRATTSYLRVAKIYLTSYQSLHDRQRHMGQCEDAPGRTPTDDQLYAYLKLHEAHANENKMMLDRFTQHTVDPLALMSNVAPQQYNSQSSTYNLPYFADNSQLDSRLSPTDNLLRIYPNIPFSPIHTKHTFLKQTINSETSSNLETKPQFKTAGLWFRMFKVDRIEDWVNHVHGCYNYNGIGHIARNCTQPKRPQNSEYFKDKMLLMQAQENGVALDEEQLLFLAGGQDNAVDEDADEQPGQDLTLNVDNVFQADDCDAFDSDVDEAPTAQTMFMDNISSADPVYDEADPSYDSDILSEVHDHDHYQDAICEHHEEHEMHDDVQPNYVVDSHADYTSNSHMIPYDRYVKDNAVPVVQSNVSSITNDAYMMIYNDMCEPHAESVSKTTRNHSVDNSLTVELETYKEQVELYERRARFELTEREQKIDEQLRIVITDRNIKEENLKKEKRYSVEIATFFLHHHNMLMSQYIIKMKAKALKEQTTASRPTKSLTVYPPNTPATLVPRVLPTKRSSKTKSSCTRESYAIDIETYSPRNRNNREVHLVYLKHFKESVETLREIVKEAKVKRPLDISLASACRYTKHSQELLEYVIGTCLKALNTRDNKHASTSLPKKKQVIFKEQCAMSKSNTHKPIKQLNCQKTNVPVPPSTRVNSCTDASRSQPRSNTKKNKILPAKSVNMKKVKEHPRTIKSSLKTTNRVDSSISSKRTEIARGSRISLKKFIGTVRFGIFMDHLWCNNGYGDYVIGKSVISSVYYVEGLGHNLFSIG